MKDFWDKVSSVSTFLSSVIIALVGLVFTHSYNERQALRDQVVKEQQLRLAQVELVQKFTPQLTGSATDKKLAIIAIASLGNTELATNLAALDRSEGSREALEAIATAGKTEAERNLAAEALQNFIEYAPMISQIRGGSQSGRKALDAAIQELKAGSYEEGGDNRGPRIGEYLAVVGLREGLPWSAAFVSWCFSQIPEGAPFKPSGGFQAILEQFQAKKWLHTADTGYIPQPGDVMFIMSETGPGARAKHGGIVLRYENGRVHVIEGNVKQMLVALPRQMSSRLAFGHVPD
jgi:hypothetical protein